MLLAMETVIDVQHVTKTYGGRRAVDDVSLQVEEGEIFAILGPNGAGKTTLVESIAGLRADRLGAASACSGSTRAATGTPCASSVGVQLQESALPDNLRVWEALDLYASFYANPADWRTLLVGARPRAAPATRGSQSCPAARSSACRSRSRSSAILGSRCSTS